MSHVTCAHECYCDCHDRVIRKGGPYDRFMSAPIHIFEPPEDRDIVHAMPCCDGLCRCCGRAILAGRMKDHLVACHKMSIESAKRLLKEAA